MTQKVPLISVIVPVYNAEKYIARCVGSVVNQSMKDLELILVDDLSTDNSRNVINSISKGCEFIRCINMEKKGFAGGARNVGLDIARGKYISFLDCDDWVDSNMYKKCLNLLEKNQGDISICGVVTEYTSPFEFASRYEYDIENTIEGKLALELMCRQYNQDISISPLMGNKIFRRNFLNNQQLRFIENCYNDDDVFNYFAFLNAQKVVITPNTYLHYYQQENSITHSFSKKHVDDLLYAFRVIKSTLQEKGLYESQMANYYPFFEKCLAFVLGVLHHTEPNRKVQNDYLNYFWSQCDDLIALKEYIEYLGLFRVRKFLNPKL